MLQELIALQKEVYEGNKARGFWEEGKDRNKGEAVMLIITELSEAVESHRKSRFGIIGEYEARKSSISMPTKEETIQEERHIFELYIKDTVEDELADAVIRILDTTYGFGWNIVFPAGIKYNMPRPFEGNFAENILRVTHTILNAYHEAEWAPVLPKIIKLAENSNIDLLWHVKAKLAYNATRPFKHGKAY